MLKKLISLHFLKKLYYSIFIYSIFFDINNYLSVSSKFISIFFKNISSMLYYPSDFNKFF
jgi:hypothetical protein